VLLEHKQVWVLTDDMYEHLVYDYFASRRSLQVEPRLYERTLTMNGVSRPMHDRWRIGYAGGPAALFKAIAHAAIAIDLEPEFDQPGGGGGGAQRALDFVPRHNAIFKQRRDLVVDMLNKAKGFVLSQTGRRLLRLPVLRRGDRPPDAAGQAHRADSDFVEYLLEAEGVAAVQGAAFRPQPAFPHLLRDSTEALRDACTRIAGLRRARIERGSPIGARTG